MIFENSISSGTMISWVLLELVCYLIPQGFIKNINKQNSISSSLLGSISVSSLRNKGYIFWLLLLYSKLQKCPKKQPAATTHLICGAIIHEIT